MEFVDIAGLVEGAAKGEGLGNKFLGCTKKGYSQPAAYRPKKRGGGNRSTNNRESESTNGAS